MYLISVRSRSVPGTDYHDKFTSISMNNRSPSSLHLSMSCVVNGLPVAGIGMQSAFNIAYWLQLVEGVDWDHSIRSRLDNIFFLMY